MKGLFRYLSPFAPDISGACSVLFGLGGMIVICDAGGCTGNTCGFDEPRWYTQKSAVFSAGLRDLDAILGRDDRLLDKIEKALTSFQPHFLALIGTPAPSVIATDYAALCRIGEKRFGLPCIYIDTTGMETYEIGQQKAYRALRPMIQAAPTDQIGQWGATPLDLPGQRDGLCFDQWEDWTMAGGTKQNLVLSPSGLETARYLKERFGIPYDRLRGTCRHQEDRRILIVHQQIYADYVRDCIGTGDVASFFTMDAEYKQTNDIQLDGETEWIQLVKNGDYDVIMGDPMFQQAIPDFSGTYIPLPQFAVSGQMHQADSAEAYEASWRKALWNE
ncbi:nitrogenase component 1 [Catenisphaera adipataccumulans]|jgi:hypothetical protein|uniref:Nitrogenase/oxidoreductase component 1 domain-containing protein n=1 Tax=Catenisphaera adipataccumulans TaxID=700500 RepID=A0A7W8CUY5_9FIRM|nr:nitrogenase component 1 [Catenisphaera adipataccumulans]MBB5182070.1 hypothetical protein [Catenisphaera adipataccumulans]